MAAAPIIGVAVGAASSAASIAQQNRQAQAQRQALAVQAQSVEDQRKLNQLQIAEQRRQAEAMAERERLLSVQAKTMGLISNEMQAAQQSIAQTQAQIAADQQEYMNNQRAIAREAQASLAAMETLKQLQGVVAQSRGEQSKTEQEANAIAAQRLLLQGIGAANTESGKALIDRMINTIADRVTNTTNVFNSGMSDAEKQLAYEKTVAELERQLGSVSNSAQRDALQRAALLNEIQRRGIAQNIDTQSARNLNAIDYDLASKKAMYAIGSAAQDVQASSQQQAIKAQMGAIRGASFADYLGAIGNLGLGLYQSGIFQRQPQQQQQSPYSVMSNIRLTPYTGTFDADGLLSGKLSIGGTAGLGVGANDLMSLRNIG
jgi:hypothetical protein